MSVKCMTRVWNHSRSKRSARLVLLAIADYAHNDDGTGVWVGQAKLAEKAGFTDRQLRTILTDLVESGELHIEPSKSGRRTNDMAVLVEAISGCTCYGCDYERKKLPVTPEETSAKNGKNFRSNRKRTSYKPVPNPRPNPERTVAVETAARGAADSKKNGERGTSSEDDLRSGESAAEVTARWRAAQKR